MDNDQSLAKGPSAVAGSGTKQPLPTTADLDQLKHTRPSARTYFAGALRETREISVTLKVVTPILGGSYRPRHIDGVDRIRPSSVRAHLRFWWRALYAHMFANPRDLYDAESALWGRAADETGGRSAVQVRIAGIADEGRVHRQRVNPRDNDAYALWPAGVPRDDPAERREPGTRFTLAISAVSAPSASPCITDSTAEQINKALKAWIMFGGYGGRTRRGLGSVTVFEQAGRQEAHEEWLPGVPTRRGIQRLFGSDIFAGSAVVQTPTLAGASLLVGQRVNSPKVAWETALQWLRDFRQSVAAGAREPGTADRPSISNWPEADKIRHLSRPRRTGKWAHDPSRHNATPAWPRAGFGLPIAGQFQRKSRVARRDDARDTLPWEDLDDTHPNYGEEPGRFDLRWQSGGTLRDRLASPLIVKALPLADGDFVPCALWLARAMPLDAKVGLYDERTRQLVARSLAPFEGPPLDGLLAPADHAHFTALANKPTLRRAFLDWLKAKPGLAEVAP